MNVPKSADFDASVAQAKPCRFPIGHGVPFERSHRECGFLRYVRHEESATRRAHRARCGGPAWRNGIRRGLKILRGATPMWVRIPPPALATGSDIGRRGPSISSHSNGLCHIRMADSEVFVKSACSQATDWFARVRSRRAVRALPDSVPMAAVLSAAGLSGVSSGNASTALVMSCRLALA